MPTVSNFPTVSDTESVVGTAPSEPVSVQTAVRDADSSPLVRIRSLLPGLARAEQRVAKVVLEDPASVARRSITEVALAANTSETTVTRFCKAVGVGGYPQLRIALAADTARTEARTTRNLGGEISPEDDLAAVIGKVSFADARAVEETADQLEVATLEKVIEVVANAGRVDVYGVGASAFVAADLQQKLHRIGRVCFAWSDTHIMLTSAAVLSPGDVAIGVSHTGATTDTVEALRVAREHGAITIAVTNFPRSPITEVADHVLTTAARETTFRSGATASRIAQLTVIDCLFIGVAQRHMDASVSALDATRDAVGSHRLGVRPDGRRRPRETGK
ncbi:MULTISPECIES: MurR/RpiR family transcriptional regulator [Amycolatopsis]|uniref:DNA-binding transcriptional regulator, MurR/RpiR family, contains HTH and SIS domains n=1 Tax=Amycolatopsis tolypomycina TaxID=208445 RepID=A0A1H5DGU5_9PSEU|nr:MULTISPECIES: MurR/RpiR family transcriptional regulator [Amycolatopsis]SED78135.1 DNA-binding transcriptional regulator, MurR/RpiR family, contains HTH and SIS domains [Amycolatopsis tolypomycina]HET6711282.1 MurR/RpiR family transcriptional regulator [Amycolatopsis sp.]